MYKYLKPLRIKKYSEKTKIVADFETIIINKTHYVYAIGYTYQDMTYYRDFFIEGVDNNSNEEEVKEKSLELIHDFISEILSKFDDKVFIYFHNLRSFDGFFIVHCINKHFNDCSKKILIRNNLIYKIILNNIEFLDTLNIINDTLNNISKSFFNKSKKDFDTTSIIYIDDINTNYITIKEYLMMDVELLLDIVNTIYKKFVDIFNIDITRKITISSISFTLYRQKYLKEDFLIEITKGVKYDFIKKSYYGGLTNVHIPYTNIKSYSYDVNSLYPYVMSCKELPLGKSSYFRIDKDSQKTYNINNIFGFIKCTIYIPKNIVIPPLPIKNSSGTCYQPTGFVKGIWFSEEVKNAVSLGCVLIAVFEVISYDSKGVIFKDFVNDLYTKRVKSNSNIDKMLYKNIMNSLYGRFGINRTVTHTSWGSDDDEYIEYFSKNDLIYADTIKVYQIDDDLYEDVMHNNSLSNDLKNKIANVYNKIKMEGEYIFSCIQIASAIASYARIKLMTDMHRHIIDNKAIIYYYDTDSIFTDKPLNDSIISKSILGRYKLENVFYEAVFLAPKTYILKNENSTKTKFKSLRKKDKLNLTIEKYKSMLKKNSKYNLYNVKVGIQKNFRYMISNSLYKNYSFNFISDKYEKIYDDNDIFIGTKPIHIDIDKYLNDIK